MLVQSYRCAQSGLRGACFTSDHGHFGDIYIITLSSFLILKQFNKTIETQGPLTNSQF